MSHNRPGAWHVRGKLTDDVRITNGRAESQAPISAISGLAGT